MNNITVLILCRETPKFVVTSHNTIHFVNYWLYNNALLCKLEDCYVYMVVVPSLVVSYVMCKWMIKSVSFNRFGQCTVSVSVGNKKTPTKQQYTGIQHSLTFTIV